MVFSIFLILLGGFIAASNWYAPIRSKREERHVSTVPLIGVALLGGGIYTLSGSLLWALLAIPFDLGTVLFLLGLPWLFSELWQTSWFNELANFIARDNGREVLITLYRNGRVSINQEYNGTVGPLEHGFIPVSRGYSGKWRFDGDAFHLTEITGGRELRLVPTGDKFISTESNLESDAKTHTLMDNLVFEQTKNRIREIPNG